MSDGTPQLWLLAGGNGAGKSTFYRTRLAHHGVEFVNADDLEKALRSTSTTRSYEAAAVARERFRRYIDLGYSFCYETVFSHRSKLDMLSAAKARGYTVNLVFLHLARPELNEARVAQRVSESGHAVPREKIHSRLPRTLALVRESVQVADRSLLFDNSSAANPFELVASKAGGSMQLFVEPLPDWAIDVLSLPGG